MTYFVIEQIPATNTPGKHILGVGQVYNRDIQYYLCSTLLVLFKKSIFNKAYMVKMLMFYRTSGQKAERVSVLWVIV